MDQLNKLTILDFFSKKQKAEELEKKAAGQGGGQLSDPPNAAELHTAYSCSSIDEAAYVQQHGRRLDLLQKALQESIRENERYVNSVSGIKTTAIQIPEANQSLIKRDLPRCDRIIAEFAADIGDASKEQDLIGKIDSMLSLQKKHISSHLSSSPKDESTDANNFFYYLRDIQLIMYKQSILDKKYPHFNDKNIPKPVDVDRQKTICTYITKYNLVWSSIFLPALHAREHCAAEYAKDPENVTLFLAAQHANDFKEQLRLMNEHKKDMPSDGVTTFLYQTLSEGKTYCT